jgi:hypothetical protein
VAGEVVISLGGDRDDVEALAPAGARRTRRDNVPTVLVIKDPAAFADAVGRLSWKRMPAQILIDGSRVAQEVVAQIGERLSSVAPVVLAVSGSDEMLGP